MEMSYMKKYQEWLDHEYIDEQMKKELKALKENEVEIKECFYADLEFGTGGLRGKIGPGTNRMNRYTVRKATQGLANYILKAGGEDAQERGVAIAYDSRRFSKEFAEEAALVLNANGIQTYIFDQLTPTPMLSFVVRELRAISGIVVTASHNPPEYNGYKVYWEDGGQIVPELAKEVIAEVKAITDFSQIQILSEEEAVEDGLFHVIQPELVTKYIEAVKHQSFIDESSAEEVKNLKIIYTPLHGTGNIPVRRALAELGFENVTVVPEQELPDENFSTVSYPNPEEKAAFNLAIQMAEKEEVDLILGTDPDTDRIGVVEKNSEGEYVVLTGNQVGVLLTEYILSQRQERDQLPKNGVIIKTIVTTEMVRKITQKYRIQVLDTLTGFKFIGEKIKEFEETGEYEYLLGFEESYGYLIGTHARDKDAVVTATMICEMAAYYKSQGISLYQQLLNLMDEYGYYMEGLVAVTLEGLAGQEKIKQILDGLRKDIPTQVGQRDVDVVEDYLAQERYHLKTGQKEELKLPASNVLKYYFADQSGFTIRPSGTEPKVKIYLSVTGQSIGHAKGLLQHLKEQVLAFLDIQ